MPLLFLLLTAAVRGQSVLDGFDPNANGTIRGVVVQPDAASLTVNSAADSGGSCPGASCTLRQAIATAASGDTINFAAAITTIDLTSGELLIDKNLTISGPGPNLLTVERSAAPGTLEFHIFHVVPGVGATISGLAIRNGSTPSATNGGAIFNGGTLTITACTIADNLSSGGAFGGGAIYNNGGSPGATLTITNSTISGNSTLGGLGGGGINDGGGRVTITNSTISGNSSGNTSGGGIYTLGVMTITNSTVSGNSAGNGTGGGIYTFGTLTLTNSTVSGNSAGDGGGIHGRSSGTLFKPANTIIATNTAAVGPDVSGAVNSQGYNLIGNTSGATINGFTTGNQLNVDPLLGPLQNNGGPTQTQALLTNSPAIDNGLSSGSNTDQRGFTRPVDFPGIPNATGGDGSDIGAFEVQTSRPGTLGNISTRLQVGTADRVMIAGFIVQGNSPKRVLIRAAGPSLTQFGVPNALANPRLELHDTTNTIGMNDNWQTTQIGGVITSDQVVEIQNSGLAPRDPAESALIATLAPGTYTAIVQGVNSGTGVGIVEAYDLDAISGSLLANISTRGFVQTADNVMIGGFIVVTQPTKVIIRAIGPSLSQFGVPDALANPQLELHDTTSTIARNDDWQTTQIFGIITSDQVAEIQNSQLAPTNSEESAIIATLQPGNYTAIVRGINSTTGNALVEVYALQ
jgi:CSLREA domain-containing protein